MDIRSVRERVIQTTWFELVGVLAFSPLLAFVLGESMWDSLSLLLLLSITAAIVSGIFNHIFDVIEFKKTKRLASDRPKSLRVVHALLLECAIALATTPIIKFVLGISWTNALIADLGLLFLYTGYGYVFHSTYDRLRPVQRSVRAAEPNH